MQLGGRSDIGPVGEGDMTAVGQTLGDPGLEHPARAGPRDVPTGLGARQRAGKQPPVQRRGTRSRAGQTGG